MKVGNSCDTKGFGSRGVRVLGYSGVTTRQSMPFKDNGRRNSIVILPSTFFSQGITADGSVGDAVVFYRSADGKALVMEYALGCSDAIPREQPWEPIKGNSSHRGMIERDLTLG